MNAIVVTDKQWAIGRSGDLLFSLPGDMKHFRTLTTDGTVIMGRKTLDSFPGGRPLPKRRNIVITRSPDFCREGCEIVHRPEEALALAQKLSKMIQYDTTSYANVAEVEKFLGFHKVLEELFPLVHEKLEKTEIDGNLLFYWKGKSSEKPILLMSHQDVVPAEGEWIHAPFSGDIAEGKVWGRGASDTKASVMAFFQAVEELLSEGFVPPTDVYLASSCTEEWGGDGAPKIVAELQRRGIDSLHNQQ